MANIDDSELMQEILSLVDKQRVKARLVDQAFILGIASDKRPSHVLETVNKHLDELNAVGMANYDWHHHALRSTKNIGDEEIMFSVCAAH